MPSAMRSGGKQRESTERPFAVLGKVFKVRKEENKRMDTGSEPSSEREEQEVQTRMPSQSELSRSDGRGKGQQP